MAVMAETSQSAMGPYVAMAAVGLVLYAWTAVCREALVVKVPGGGDGDGGGGLGLGGSGDNGGEGDGGGRLGDGDGGDGGGIGGSGGDGDGEGGGGLGGGSGPGTAAAPPILFITRKAESILSRRAPFGCECLA